MQFVRPLKLWTFPLVFQIADQLSHSFDAFFGLNWKIKTGEWEIISLLVVLGDSLLEYWDEKLGITAHFVDLFD